MKALGELNLIFNHECLSDVDQSRERGEKICMFIFTINVYLKNSSINSKGWNFFGIFKNLTDFANFE